MQYETPDMEVIEINPADIQTSESLGQLGEGD